MSRLLHALLQRGVPPTIAEAVDRDYDCMPRGAGPMPGQYLTALGDTIAEAADEFGGSPLSACDRRAQRVAS